MDVYVTIIYSLKRRRLYTNTISRSKVNIESLGDTERSYVCEIAFSRVREKRKTGQSFQSLIALIGFQFQLYLNLFNFYNKFNCSFLYLRFFSIYSHTITDLTRLATTNKVNDNVFEVLLFLVRKDSFQFV